MAATVWAEVGRGWRRRARSVGAVMAAAVLLAVGLQVIQPHEASASSPAPIYVGCTNGTADAAAPAADQEGLDQAIETANAEPGTTPTNPAEIDLEAGCTFEIFPNSSDEDVNNTSDTAAFSSSADPEGEDGLPPITGNIAVEGNSDAVTANTTDLQFRLAQVVGGASLLVDRLTLENGLAPFGLNGSAETAQAGTNGGSGANGAGIYDAGTLTLDRSTLTQDAAGDGGSGGGGGSSGAAGYNGGNGGNAGDGGGLYISSTGSAFVTASTFSHDRAGSAGSGGAGGSGAFAAGNGGNGGSGGSGGGIYNAGSLHLSRSTFSSNSIGAAGSGGQAGSCDVSCVGSTPSAGSNGSAGQGADSFNDMIWYKDTVTTFPDGEAVTPTASTTVAVTSTATTISATAAIGGYVTYTATVTPSPAVTAPNGDLSFVDQTNGTFLPGCANQAVTPNAGTETAIATCSVDYLTPGSYQVAAVYAGDQSNAGSASTAYTETVSQVSGLTFDVANPEVDQTSSWGFNFSTSFQGSLTAGESLIAVTANDATFTDDTADYLVSSGVTSEEPTAVTANADSVTLLVPFSIPDSTAVAVTANAVTNPSSGMPHYGPSDVSVATSSDVVPAHPSNQVPISYATPSGSTTAIYVPCGTGGYADAATALIPAIQSANSNATATESAPAEIDLAPGCTYGVSPADTGATYTDSSDNEGPNGLPVITGHIAIEGSSDAVTADNSDVNFRFLQVDSSASLQLDRLTLVGTQAAAGATGTGSGSLTAPANPGGDGQSGGAVYDDGTLTLDGASLSDDQAGAGGTGGVGANSPSNTDTASSGGPGGTGGDGGDGGGVFVAYGATAYVVSSFFSGDLAGAGGTGGRGGNAGSDGTGEVRSGFDGGNGGSGGSGGSGGAIYDAGTLHLSTSLLSSNSPGGASGGGTGGAGTESCVPVEGCTPNPNGTTGTAGAAGSGPDSYTSPAATDYQDPATQARDGQAGAGVETATTPTATTLAASQVGENVTYTATVTSSSSATTPDPSGTTPPGGTVSFVDETSGSYLSGCEAVAVTPNAGTNTATATCSVTFSQAGSYDVAAVYQGDNQSAGSSSCTYSASLSACGVSFTVANPVAGETSQWGFDLTTSPNGAVTANESTVAVTANAATFSSSPSDYTLAIEGESASPTAVAVTNNGSTVTLTLPFDIPASTAVSVTANNVTNPPTATVEQGYDVAAATSSDVVPGYATTNTTTFTAPTTTTTTTTTTTSSTTTTTEPEGGGGAVGGGGGGSSGTTTTTTSSTTTTTTTTPTSTTSPPPSVTVTASTADTNTNPDGAAEASLNSTTAGAPGTGTVALEQYSGDPDAQPSFDASGYYFDVSVSYGNSFASLTVTVPVTDGGDQIQWYNPSTGTWAPVSDQTYDPATGTVTFTVTNATSPDLAQMTGTVFALAYVPPSSLPKPAADGYRFVAGDGGVFAYGTSAYYGSEGGKKLNQPIVGGAASPTGHGYWLVASDGGIFTFGDAAFDGSQGAEHLAKPIVGMAGDPLTGGYWLVASDGGVFTHGASFYGSTGAEKLNSPIVGMASTPDGKGYWLVASDGGVFSFGDAVFHGSATKSHLPGSVTDLVATPDGAGYWVTSSGGGVATFGDATGYGSAAGKAGSQRVVGLIPTPDAHGYWLIGSAGTVWSFGDATNQGSPAGKKLAKPVVGVIAADISRAT